MTDNSSEIGMRDCIKQAAAAVSREDLESYVSCFTDTQKKQLRRKAALLFVRHTMTLELIDCHLVEETYSHATWAIKYKALLTDAGYDVVSLLYMHKENNEWKIRREEVETSEKSQPAYESDPLRRGGCAGGAVPFGGAVARRGD
jgi:ketosteroid isomerase-like protein